MGGKFGRSAVSSKLQGPSGAVASLLLGGRAAARARALGLVAGIVAMAGVGTAGCANAEDLETMPPGPMDAAPSLGSDEFGRGVPFVQPPTIPFDPNPFGLSASVPALAAGAQLFAVPQRMLANAREGASLALRLASVERIEGGDVVVRMGREAPYPVHPAYVIVPPRGQLRRGTAVIAAYRGGLAHAVVVTLKRDTVGVRFTDVGSGLAEHVLNRDQAYPQSPGLAPGNYAVVGEGQRFEHVLLVSGSVRGTKGPRWLVLGHAGTVKFVDERELTALPLTLSAKPGSSVAVAWLGSMVPAKVIASEAVGLLTVRRPRAAPSFVVGPGMVLEAIP